MEEKNNGISDSRYKSRFFKKLAAWMGKRGAVLTAVVLIAVSAILGCAEATIIYAAKGNEASNDYGTRGNTSSPSYIGGSGNNPTVYEPGVIGVSVVTYDLNEVNKKGTLYYGGDKDNPKKGSSPVASTNDPEVVKKAMEDLPALYAYDIKWDTDGDQEILDSLPKEIRIPDGMVDDEEISDHLSAETGFCHAGFKLGIYFRGKIMPCNTNWLDDDTFQMWFGEGIFKDYEGDSYLIKFEKHLNDNEWVVEIIWEDDCTTIDQICCNADDYITANEIWKIERICEKMIQPDSDEVPDTDGKENSAVELGKTYQFAGYKWTACELINKGKTLVIQSHGVTHGKWPGFKMEKFGNGNYYADSIDGQDISAYDNKMQALYDAIEDVEDTSASYGKGLYLISEEEVGFTELGHPGSGNYWQALKAAAENARSFWAAYCAWLGTVDDSSAWCIHLNGNVYCGSNQTNGFVVAPAFNLDLSKVEIVGDEIVIRKSVKNARNTKKEKIREFLHEIYEESEILPENFGDEIVAELEERFLEDGYEITKKNAIEEMLWCYMCKMQ